MAPVRDVAARRRTGAIVAMTAAIDRAPTARPRKLVVASYNIHSGRGRDGKRVPRRIADVLREIDGDIVGLQEVDWRPGSGEAGGSQATYFSDLIGFRALAGPNIRDHRGHFGNVLLTRLPVVAYRTHDLSVAGREPRGAIDAILGGDGGTLRAITTHLGLRPAERRRQAQRLAEIVSAAPATPTVLLGDLNEWRIGSPSLAALSDLFGNARQPRSFPARRPILRLDRILWRGCAAAGAVEIHGSALARIASDHLPVKSSAMP